MRRTTALALLVSCALAAPASVWAAPTPDLSVAVGIVWDDMGLPYALTFDAETELGEAAWNITDGMGLVWPHTYTVDDIEWGNQLGYTHIHLDGERHAVVAADDGIPVLVHVGEAEPYTGENSFESGSGMEVNWGGGHLVVIQKWWTGYPGNATTAIHSFHDAAGPAAEFSCMLDLCHNLIRYDDHPHRVVHIDGEPHMVVNTVDGPPVLAGPMEAAALGLGDITAIPPDVCVWYDGPAWADCEHAPDGPPPPLPAPTVPFIFTIGLEYPYTWFDVEVGGPGPYTIDWGDGNVQTITGDPIVDPHAPLGVFPPPQPKFEPRDRPAEIRHDFGGGWNGQVSITGNVDWVRIGDKHLVSIDQWGDIRWKSMNSAFAGSPNLVLKATDVPDLSRVTDMSRMFVGAHSVVGVIRGDAPDACVGEGIHRQCYWYGSGMPEWDVSQVTNMKGMFYGVDSIGDISGWNVSQVANVNEMFWYVDSPPNLGNWFITLDDLTVADDDPVVGRVAPQSPSFYGHVSYEVVGPADGTFHIEPGDPVLTGSGAPFVVESQQQVQYGFAPAVLADPAVPFVAANGTVYESLLVLDPNHNLTLGTHNVTIRSTGPLGYPSTHTAQVTVQYVAPNRPPVAWAETGLLAVPSGSVVMLNGTKSYDPDGDSLEYMWNQTGGVPVALHGMDSPYPTFTAPAVQHLNTLTFELVVNDGTLDSPSYTVTVLVEPARP